MKRNSELDYFYNELKAIVKEEELMPFVCNGNPLHANIIIIGYNPTTSYNFWDFFSLEKGFDSNAEFENYKKNRRDKRKTEVSITRKRIRMLEQEILSNFPAITILKMNLYAKATRREKDLQKIDQDLEIFNFLIKNLHPRIIVVHGRKPQKYLKSLDMSQSDLIHISDIPILYEQHFSSRGYSFEQINQLSQKILNIYNNQANIVKVISPSDPRFHTLLATGQIALGNDPAESLLRKVANNSAG